MNVLMDVFDEPPKDKASIYTSSVCAELYFLGFDYNTGRKKLFDLKSFLKTENKELLEKDGIKIRLLNDKDAFEAGILSRPWPCDTFFCDNENNQLSIMEYEGFDIDFYSNMNTFALTSKIRRLTLQFHDLKENYYAITYDGDLTGQDYEDMLALNRAGREDYYKTHGKYPEEDDEEEEWNLDMKFVCSEKNKAFKDSNGEVRKKEKCLKLTDKMYYEMINAKEVTVKHIIQLFTLQTPVNSSFSDKMFETGKYLNKLGHYTLKSLLQLKKFMDFDDTTQYFFSIHSKTYETDVITHFQIKIDNKENHIFYYFYKTRLPVDVVMRVIRTPKINMDPHDRKIHPDGGKYVNGFCMYDHGVIFPGGQDESEILNYALAEQKGIKIPNDVAWYVN